MSCGCTEPVARKPESARARRKRLAARNARQQAWRARPGGAEYEARAARKTYWSIHPALMRRYRPSCSCAFCTQLRTNDFRAA